MKKVIILSKKRFDSLMESNKIYDSNVENVKNSIFISIRDYGFRDHYFSKKHENVLNIQFDDTEKESESSFNKELANRIIQFVKRNENAETAFVHCSAGVSRSGAVGEFIQKVWGISYENFRKINPQIVPNSLVYNTLLKNFNF